MIYHIQHTMIDSDVVDKFMVDGSLTLSILALSILVTFSVILAAGFIRFPTS